MSVVVAETETEVRSVYAMKYAGDMPMPMWSAFYAGPRYYPNESDPMNSFYYWLVRTDKHNILIDTGLSAELAAALNFPNYFPPKVMLKKVGLSPADIDTIILTHGHFDHIDGITSFKNSHVYFQRECYRFMVETGPQYRFMREKGYPRKVDSLTMLNLLWDGRLKLLDGDTELFPGIKVIRVDGHMPGHQIVVVETKEKTVILTSDAVNFYLNLERDHPMGAANGSQVDLIKGFETIRGLKGTVIPGHDATVMDRFKKIDANVVQIF